MAFFGLFGKSKSNNKTEQNYHMVKRTFPIRMIFPMPTVAGEVYGSVVNGGGSVSGSVNTRYGLMIFYERENGGWRYQIFDSDDLVELMHYTDEESHVVVQYQCSNSDNTIIKTFYDGIYINRYWQHHGGIKS